MKIKSLLVLVMLFARFLAWSAVYTPKYQLIDNPAYPTSDLAVSTFNVLDYGVDNSGKKDCTATVQALLDAAAGVGSLSSINGDSNQRGWYANPAGGIVYFPAGQYLFNSNLIVPRGVCIRGDWKKPSLDGNMDGTIFIVAPRRGVNTEIENSSFIIMQPSTEVQGITFWYPDQDPSNIRKYPPTILLGQTGYWGNEYTTVFHCTFVNSYTGVQFNSQNGGGCPNVFDIYGTPLSKGLVVDCLADVGRFDGLYFAADYWEKSGFENAPANGQIDAWLYENAIGLIMRRNDWSYTCNLNVNGYKNGFIGESSPENANTKGNPNGHNYGFNITNCKNGIVLTGCGNSGIMFSNVNISECEIGLNLPVALEGPVLLYGCDISGNEKSINMSETSSPGLLLQDCRISGLTDVGNGQFTAVNNSFSKDVNIAPQARTIFVGNRFYGNAKLNNNSLFVCEMSEDIPQMRSLPDFKSEWMQRRNERPAKSELFVVTDAEFGAVPSTYFDDLKMAKDNTSAFQKALDKAGANGGGIVYIPVGHYRIDGKLTIPAGVEMKGASDIMTTPKGNGSILESYYGEGDEDAEPFINMERGSGLRGLTINYPNQTSPIAVKKYPYSVRGNADTYIVNLQIRTAYRGIDLFTNKCDNHYVDYLAGHAFKNVIRVGGNSCNGMISNIQCNTIAYACGDETKFGAWANSEIMKDGKYSDYAYGQNEEDLDFMIIGDCTDEILYNNFLFGCRRGMLFQNDGNGGAKNVHSLGNAVDGAVETFVFDGGEYPIDLINSQVVALNHDRSNKYINTGKLSASFIVSGKNFNSSATFFSGNYWGSGDCLITAESGTVNLYNANLATSGSQYTIKSSDDAKINFVNVWRRKGNTLFDKSGTAESRCRFNASMVDCPETQQKKFDVWENILPTVWSFNKTTQMLSRSGWKATAFNDMNGSLKARLAIDNSISTRWSTDATQAPGQWFAVDFGKTITFNTAILDASPSSGDGPIEYNIEIFEPESEAWREVANGSNAPETLVVTFETCKASKIRINQTGKKTGGYWSIHEFNLANTNISSGINDVISESPFNLEYLDGNLCISSNSTELITVSIYNINGTLLDTFEANTGINSLETLTPGFYVVKACQGDKSRKTLKIVVK